jgi:hypothetical protein
MVLAISAVGVAAAQAVDQLAFSVRDLDAWVATLKRENITFPRGLRLRDARAVLIEGPSHAGH